MNKKIFFLIALIAIIVPSGMILAQTGNNATLTAMAGRIKDVLITIGASVVVIGWIIAGILYLTAAGAPDKLSVAKKAVFACVIGTVLVILADASNTITEVIENAFRV